MKKLLPFYIALVMQVVTCLFIMWFAYLYFVPIRVITPNTQPYSVITKKVQIGDQLTYVVDACKFKDAPAVVSRSFVEAGKKTIYPAISEVNRLKIGCNKSNVSITVPPILLPGRYYLQLDVTYRVNFLREENYHFETEEFEILPMEGGAE